MSGSGWPYAKELLWARQRGCKQIDVANTICAAVLGDQLIMDRQHVGRSEPVNHLLASSRNALRRHFMTSSAMAMCRANVGSQDVILHPPVRR